MAEQWVRVDNPATDPVNVTGTVNSIATPNPSLRGVYLFSVAEDPGIVAANNFASIFNPVGSGRLVFISALFFSCTSSSAAQETAPMRGFRITTATGGVLAAASSVCKFNSLYPDAAAEVRTGNPAVTLGAAAFNFPPVITAGVGGSDIHDVTTPAGSPPFILREGEGIVIRTAAGDTDQRWNYTIAWAEV